MYQPAIGTIGMHRYDNMGFIDGFAIYEIRRIFIIKVKVFFEPFDFIHFGIRYL